MLKPNVATMNQWLNNFFPRVPDESQDYLQIGRQSDGVIVGWIDENGIPRGTLAAGEGSGTVTNLEGALTPNFFTIGNGGADIQTQPNLDIAFSSGGYSTIVKAGVDGGAFQVLVDMLDSTGVPGTANQVPTSQGAGSGWKWQTPGGATTGDWVFTGPLQSIDNPAAEIQIFNTADNLGTDLSPGLIILQNSLAGTRTQIESGHLFILQDPAANGIEVYRYTDSSPSGYAFGIGTRSALPTGPPSWFWDVNGNITVNNLTISGNSGPTWTSGSGAPSGTATPGSLYSRTSGGAGTSLYVFNGTTWTAVA